MSGHRAHVEYYTWDVGKEIKACSAAEYTYLVCMVYEVYIALHIAIVWNIIHLLYSCQRIESRLVDLHTKFNMVFYILVLSL